MRRLAANTGKVDPRLQIEWPPLGRPIWNVFRRLGRPPSINGMEPINMQEIQAYQNVRRVRLTDWELDVIDMFDSIALEISNEK